MTRHVPESGSVNQPHGSEAQNAIRPKPKMVDWYSPGQLVRTGMRAAASALLGEMLDPRRLLAVQGTNEECEYDYSSDEEFSFDYLADTGDGWDSTYTMAYLATTPYLEVADGENSLILERPDALILGGDEVYPVASKTTYAQRLQDPFHQAAVNVRRDANLPRLPRKDVYLIPGNHDWYDGLGSMSQRFFTYSHETNADGSEKTRKRRSLGQYLTRQVRSYFVLKLPQDWEMWCVDIQLGNDIDPQQFSFFSWHADRITPDTKVILCSAVPTIVYGSDLDNHDEKARGESRDELVFGLNRIAGLAYHKRARIMAQIAGDVHNYQHYVVDKKDKDENVYQRHHIVCGGGGAFLHPTHGFNGGSVQDPRIEPLERYPSRETSKRVSRGVFAFPFAHMGMSVLIGSLYLAMFWAQGPPSLDTIASHIVGHPGSILLMLAVIAGCAVFAKEKRWWGVVHGVAHIAAAILIWKLAAAASPLYGDWNVVMERVVVLVFGSLLGGFVFGAYLWLSLNWLRIHHNEAFSALANPHYKCMLRCQIASDGSLSIHVIGVDTTAREDESHPVRTHLVETIRL